MKSLTTLVLAAVATMVLVACEQPEQQVEVEPEPSPEPETTERVDGNPLLERYLTPFRMPPLHRADPEDYLPALNHLIEQREALVQRLAESDQPASFENTIEPLEMESRRLELVADTFFTIVPVAEDPQFRSIATEFAASLAAHRDRVHSEARLFERIKAVRDRVDELEDAEQRRLTELTYQRFRQTGSGLDPSDRETLTETGRRIAEMQRQLQASIHAATDDYELLIEDAEQLQGLPELLVNQALRNARERGHDHGWVITLHDHSLFPFLRHSPDPELRQQLFTAWRERIENAPGDHNSPIDLIDRIAALRARRAELLGYESYAEYRLSTGGIGSIDSALELIDRVAEAATARVGSELDAISGLARADGIDGELQPWDLWYYAERLREQELGVEEAGLRQWFSLEQVREGAFALANRLWGLSYHERTDLPVWHPEVQAFEVRDAMGEHLGVILFDLRHRAGKYGGHRVSTIRPAHREHDERIAPIVVAIANLPPAVAGTPSLLSPGEVRQLFGLFGQALQELFSEAGYPSLSAAAAPDDSRQLPARLMARWALEPEVVRMYAYHHETGNMINDETIEAINRKPNLTAGMDLLERIAAIRLDLGVHGSTEPPGLAEAERQVTEALGLPAPLSPRHHDQGLLAVFADEAGGDLGKLWAEMLAADIFAMFRQATVMDRELAARLRETVLAPGHGIEALQAFRDFRQRDPQVDYLLQVYGL